MNTIILDTEDDDDDDDFLLGDDYWEDLAFPEKIKQQYEGWYLLKIANFTPTMLKEIRQWMVDNCTRGQAKDVGWYSGCAYSVGVVIENPKDAMLFRLRWN